MLCEYFEDGPDGFFVYGVEAFSFDSLREHKATLFERFQVMGDHALFLFQGLGNLCHVSGVISQKL